MTIPAQYIKECSEEKRSKLLGKVGHLDKFFISMSSGHVFMFKKVLGVQGFVLDSPTRCKDISEQDYLEYLEIVELIYNLTI